MDAKRLYLLPDLPYGYKDLASAISEEQLRIHHTKHHKAYVDAANGLLQSLEKAREENKDIDYGTVAKQLAFNTGGHRLHSLFWKNLRKPVEGNKPEGKIAEAFCPQVQRPLIMQIEKHNVNVTPKRPILMVLDVWEHAYYIDYRNDRAKYIEGFWGIVDWSEADKRLGELL